MRVLGVDIGGTRIKAALLEHRRVVARHTVPTPQEPREVV